MTANAAPRPLEIVEGCWDRVKRFRTWKQRFLSYLLFSVLSKKNSKYEVAALITSLDSDALEVFNSLDSDSETDKESIETSLKLKEEHCVCQVSPIYGRSVFFKRCQQPEETFDSYLTPVKTLASTCEFNIFHDEMIRDRLKCGIANASLQRQLLQESLSLAE